MPRWEPRRADRLERNDVILVEPGHLRVVTDLASPAQGRVHVRLGTTWYALTPDREVMVDAGRPNGAAR